MKSFKKQVFISVIILISLMSLCFPVVSKAQFVKGGDVGWLQQMDATGYQFYDSTGVQKDCLQILKDHGINTVRLRVWVNPSNDKISGHCSKKDVAGMAVRAKNMGMKIMIDFHYSDSWADPGKQNKPAAWASDSFTQLLTDLYNHTYQVLDTLKLIGVKPDWVQIGNEITGGMLWPDGSTSNWPQLGQLLNKGYDATKTVDSSIKVIIHLDQGNNNSRFRTFFDNAATYNVRYDIIGVSYYPYWLGTDYTLTINDLGTNLNDMVARYGKDVMVVEVGGDYTLVQNTYDMLVAVMNKVHAVPNNKGLGVIYWEPEGEKSWSGYQLSCWGSNGKPTAALNAFLVHLAGINSLSGEKEIHVHPNPYSGGVLNVEMKGFSGLNILKIVDTSGQVLNEIKLNDQIRVTLYPNLSPGIYFIRVNNGQKEYSEKLIVK
jgi:arabinogalactan endo-1,4-beta-galactosidase